MSAYRRFISYMYDCNRQRNQKNCGFVKIEYKNHQCFFYFQLQNAPCRDLCSLYLCFRDRSPAYVLLASIQAAGGSTRYKLQTDLDCSDCCGILCIDEHGNKCCTCWDSIGALPEFQKETEPLDSEEEPPEETISEEKPSEEPLPEEPPKTEKAYTPHNFSELWEHMQKEFPPMDPFEDDAVIETIKISPADLSYLQACGLDIGTNQFLLHGYKSYHHLLTGRIKGQMQYIIGIPGIYDPQEQFMARMFGFPCFKPIRESRQKNGQFGYWLRCFH